MNLMMITTNNQDEKLERSGRVFKRYSTIMSAKRMAEILTPHGDKLITRQAVNGYIHGKSKPLTDRLLDVIESSDDPQATAFCTAILREIWPRIDWSSVLNYWSNR